jgi:hypothetical protein
MLPPNTKQELRMLFYEIHVGDSNVKQRFDDEVAKPKASGRRNYPSGY